MSLKMLADERAWPVNCCFEVIYFLKMSLKTLAEMTLIESMACMLLL